MINIEENKIVLEVITDDMKYLSIRKLFYDWFFLSGLELANQLIDSIIKLYLKAINRDDLVAIIRGWGGNESHNIVKILELCIKELGLDFNIDIHRSVLETIFKAYRIRYLDQLGIIGEVKGGLQDINTIDYAYKYFRDLIRLSEKGRSNTLIDTVLAKGNILWGEDKNFSYREILVRDNPYFK